MTFWKRDKAAQQMREISHDAVRGDYNEVMTAIRQKADEGGSKIIVPVNRYGDAKTLTIFKMLQQEGFDVSYDYHVENLEVRW